MIGTASNSLSNATTSTRYPLVSQPVVTTSNNPTATQSSNSQGTLDAGVIYTKGEELKNTTYTNSGTLPSNNVSGDLKQSVIANYYENQKKQNELIMQAKEEYIAAQKSNDHTAMNTAAQKAVDARLNGGTITNGADLTHVIEGQNRIIRQAQKEYEEALKISGTSGMEAAHIKAELARLNGGTLPNGSDFTTVIDGQNRIINQAKQEYEAAAQTGDKAAMEIAHLKAENARLNGGTIPNGADLTSVIEGQNNIILQAQKEYQFAVGAGDKAAMEIAHQKAENARLNGGMIPNGSDYSKVIEGQNRIMQQAQAEYSEAQKTGNTSVMDIALQKQRNAEANLEKIRLINLKPDISSIISPVYYSQEDPKWSRIMYSSHNDSSQTIGTSGCGPTSMAMVVSTLTDTEVKPPELCDFAVKNGYRTYNDGTSWGFFNAAAKKYGINCIQTSSLSSVKAALSDDKHIVIASMKPGHFTKEGHIIVLHDVESVDGTDWYSVLDPNIDNRSYGSDGLIIEETKNDGRVKAKSSVFNSESTQYWIFDKPGISSNEPTGILSAKYESNDPGYIKPGGDGDYGGKSYGAWQMTIGGKLPGFVNWLKGSNPEFHNTLTSARSKDNGYGSTFDSAWKQIASAHHSEFYKLQQSYMNTDYNKASKWLKDNYGFDISNRSLALKEVLWSTVTQHGSAMILAKVNLKANDRDIINAIYNERSKVVTYNELVNVYGVNPSENKIYTISNTNQKATSLGINGKVMRYFYSSTSDWQTGVYQRLMFNERNEALKMLES